MYLATPGVLRPARLSVCLSARANNTTSLTHVGHDRSSLVLWRRCDTLCTSGPQWLKWKISGAGTPFSATFTFFIMYTQEVYRGDRTACTVEGLDFDTEYRARVKSANRVGCSSYSGIVRVHTARGTTSNAVAAYRTVREPIAHLRFSNSIRYDTRYYFYVSSDADMSQLNLPHGTDNQKV